MFLAVGMIVDLINKYVKKVININIKTMLNDEEEKDIVYAMLAHEVGHTMTCTDKYFKGEEIQPCILEWEIEADKKAVMLLENIYDNPKEILLKQINYVRNICGDIDQVDIRLTMELAQKRESALLEN